jgi:single-strand DNA-binding protein
MAGSMNKVILIGHLGADPELRHTPGGQAVATLRIATNEVWNDKEGQRQEKTEWHRVIVWGKQGETAAQYLTKGRQVCIEGRLQTREWMDKDNNKRFTTEVVSQQLTFLGGRGDSPNASAPRETPNPMGGSRNITPAGSTTGDMTFDYGHSPIAQDDDVPF